MSKARIFTTIVLFILSASLLAEADGWQSSKKKRRGAVKKMETVAIGSWGGRHVRMEVTGTGAQLEFDCAHAAITEPLRLGAGGSFDLSGRYKQEHGGPIRSDEDQDGQPARFKGHVTGQTMTLTITLEGSNEPAGSYTLEFGKATRIMKCL